MGDLWRLINIEVRNRFKGGVENRKIKYFSRYNHYRAREMMINKNKNNLYLRFIRVEI